MREATKNSGINIPNIDSINEGKSFVVYPPKIYVPQKLLHTYQTNSFPKITVQAVLLLHYSFFVDFARVRRLTNGSPVIGSKELHPTPIIVLDYVSVIHCYLRPYRDTPPRKQFRIIHSKRPCFIGCNYSCLTGNFRA